MGDKLRVVRATVNAMVATSVAKKDTNLRTAPPVWNSDDAARAGSKGISHGSVGQGV